MHQPSYDHNTNMFSNSKQARLRKRLNILTFVNILCHNVKTATRNIAAQMIPTPLNPSLSNLTIYIVSIIHTLNTTEVLTFFCLTLQAS